MSDDPQPFAEATETGRLSGDQARAAMEELAQRLREVESILVERTRELERTREQLGRRDERLARLEARQRELEEQVERALRPGEEGEFLRRTRARRSGDPIPGTDPAGGGD